VARLTAIHPHCVAILHIVVQGIGIARLISGDWSEAAIEDGIMSIRVKKRVAHAIKRRLGDCVVLSHEREPNNVAGTSRNGLWLEQQRVWEGVATYDNIVHRVISSGDRDEGKSDERSSKHYARDASGVAGRPTRSSAGQDPDFRGSHNSLGK
jgi:hypothetical protein